MIYVLLSILLSVSAWSSDDCKDLLRLSRNNEATEQWISYVEKLLEQQVLTAQDLTDMESLNPISQEKTKTSSKHLIHWTQLEKLLKSAELQASVIEQWKKGYLERHTDEWVQRDRVETETHGLYFPIQFHPIYPGSFKMGPHTDIVTTLTHEIEVMDTPVTQYQWVSLMRRNPSQWNDGEDSLTIDFQGERIQIRPNHPVENITWYSALEFANRLSIRHGLKPVYDLSDLKMQKGTSAEAGTLYSLNGGKLHIHAPNGDYYQAEGYRLPTEAEQEYLLRQFPTSVEELDKYGWRANRTESGTMAVKELKALAINGFLFFDLVGNVSEMSFDTFSHQLPGGVNPVVFQQSNNIRANRGGSWMHASSRMGPTERLSQAENHTWNWLGFRLVRTLK